MYKQPGISGTTNRFSNKENVDPFNHFNISCALDTKYEVAVNYYEVAVN